MINAQERPINIKDLIVPEPAKGSNLPFDPKRDLTEKDWAWMKETIETATPARVPKALFNMAVFKALLPDRLPQLEEQINKWRERAVGYNSSSITIKILYPEKMGEVPYNFHLFRNQLPQDIQSKNTRRATYQLLQASIGYPEKAAEIRAIEGLKTFLDGAFVMQRQHEQWTEIPLTGAVLRLLYGPDTVNLLPNEWARLHHLLDAYRTNTSYASFPDLAFQMGILSAREIHAGEDGFKLDFSPSKPLQSTASLPQVREF